MKKRKIFQFFSCCFVLLLLMAADAGAGWETMGVLKYYFDIDTTPRHVGGVDVMYNSEENEFMAVWTSSGILSDDCDPDDDYECTNSFKSLDARRISPDGERLGDAIQLSPPEVGSKSFATFAYNDVNNDYMIAYANFI